jgi:hypothetical protein
MGFAPRYFQTYSAPRRILLAVVVLTVISFVPHIPHVSYRDPMMVAQMAIMKDVEDRIDDECVVVGETALFSIHKKRVYPHILLTHENAFNELRDKTDCLYLFKDYSTISDDWADLILAQCPHRLIAHRDVKTGPFGEVFRFAFYKLSMNECP